MHSTQVNALQSWGRFLAYNEHLPHALQVQTSFTVAFEGQRAGQGMRSHQQPHCPSADGFVVCRPSPTSLTALTSVTQNSLAGRLSNPFCWLSFSRVLQVYLCLWDLITVARRGC